MVAAVRKNESWKFKTLSKLKSLFRNVGLPHFYREEQSQRFLISNIVDK